MTLSPRGRRSRRAVAIRRRLAAAKPAAYEPDLARSLDTLSIRLAEVGRPRDAKAASGEAERIRKSLLGRR